LLQSHHQAANFLEQPMLSVTAEEVTGHVLANSESVISQQIGEYILFQEIGRGGMGRGYFAVNKHNQQEHFALKIIKRGMDSDSVLKRFHQEQRILATFDHPNISRLVDGGITDQGQPYFIMEYVEGQSIDEYADLHQLSVRERLELFLQVCEGIGYAHRQSVLHRDIKPSNILINSQGTPKLLDFGVAKILNANGSSQTAETVTTFRVMTPEYASPEQLTGAKLTKASDVYSLGLLLYELLTGRSPYRFSNRAPEDVLRTVTEEDTIPPSEAARRSKSNQNGKSSHTSIALEHELLGNLDKIVLMALRKEPERRYESVEQFAADVRRHLEGKPIHARSDSISYRTAKLVRRNRRLVMTGAIVAIICLI